MSVKVHEAFCMDSFMDRLLWFDDFHGDQVQDEWRVVSTGSTVVVDAQTGGIVRITTGGASGNAEQLDWNDIRSLHVDQKVTIEMRVKLNQVTQHTSWLRLYFDGNNYVGFNNFAAGGAVNWYLYSKDTALTTADSGVLADTDYHIYRIECFPTGEVHFYIDGVETANSPITTNIPDDAGDFLQPHFMMITSENIAKSMDIDYVYIRQER